MKLKYKIISGFIILALMLIIAGVISIVELSIFGKSVQKILDQNYKSINAANSMVDALDREDRGVLLLMLGNKEEGRKIIFQADSIFLSELNVAQKNITLPNENEYVNKIRNGYSDYKNTWINPIVGTEIQGNIKWYYDNQHNSFLQVKQAIRDLMILNQNAMYKTGTELKIRSEKAIMPGAVAIVAGIIFSLIFSYFIHYYVIKPITRMIKSLNDYNNYNKPFIVEIESKDEIFDLAEAIKFVFIKKSTDSKL